jgi:hypothetical protein
MEVFTCVRTFQGSSFRRMFHVRFLLWNWEWTHWYQRNTDVEALKAAWRAIKYSSLWLTEDPYYNSDELQLVTFWHYPSSCILFKTTLGSGDLAQLSRRLPEDGGSSVSETFLNKKRDDWWCWKSVIVSICHRHKLLLRIWMNVTYNFITSQDLFFMFVFLTTGHPTYRGEPQGSSRIQWCLVYILFTVFCPGIWIVGNVFNFQCK